jgi:hypothetical protein
MLNCKAAEKAPANSDANDALEFKKAFSLALEKRDTKAFAAMLSKEYRKQIEDVISKKKMSLDEYLNMELKEIPNAATYYWATGYTLTNKKGDPAILTILLVPQEKGKALRQFELIKNGGQRLIKNISDIDFVDDGDAFKKELQKEAHKL